MVNYRWLNGQYTVELERASVPEMTYDAPMKTARKLLHTRYRVDDLERTVKFYRDVLGLEETRLHKSSR
ncbi:MAG: Glyoxalase/bleomycin resistance protein/dioxygenase, partial [Pedosphaera sp.]|nr:Glyoxalase/bleomycin resistance protein/dioxygenase [Pedosphaera sp.]